MLVFAALAAVVVLAAGAAFLVDGGTGDRSVKNTSAGTPTPHSDLSLTSREAIARFKELDKARLRAFEQRDVDQLERVFVPGMVEMRRARRTINELKKDGVFMRHAPYEVRRLKVLQNTPDLIEIEQRVLFNIRFVDEHGENVTTAGAPEILHVRWIMKLHQNSWLLAAGKVVAARDLSNN